MRKKIFEKARYFIETKKIKKLSETDNSISFEVGKSKHVQLKYRNNELLCLCSCSAGSFLKPCSHILSVLIYMIQQNENEK